MDRKRKASLFLLILLSVICIGIWGATQSVAKQTNYDKALGEPVAMFRNIPVYMPYQFFVWKYKYGQVIPNLIGQAETYLFASFCIGSFLGAVVVRKGNQLTSHGSANWASQEEIKAAGLDASEGVILGWNDYKCSFFRRKRPSDLLRHDGPEHILLTAPPRTGKGTGLIVPTGLSWKHSMLVTDVKGELWKITAKYRRKYLGNKVMKFNPLESNGSSVKFNPLAEIRYRTDKETGDVMNIADMIVDPDGKGLNDHWAKTGHALLVGVVLHLLYAHQREGKLLPTMANIATFLSSPERPFEGQIAIMKTYPHITPEEFFENNIFEKIYGDQNGVYFDMGAYNDDEQQFRTIDELKDYLRSIPNLDFNDPQYAPLLTHPKAAEAAAEMENKAGNEASGVLSTAMSFLGLYRDPIIARNTSISEFCVHDLLNPDQAVSLFLVIPPSDLQRLRPLVRLLLNIVLRRLTEELDIDEDAKKQRLLLLMDEFPQFGRMDTMETSMAVMAGYGLKAMIVCQDINQINKAYGKDNSILSGCQVRVFFTPNDNETANLISRLIGKQTIKVDSISNNGSVFKSSRSTSEIARDLMAPEEVSKLSDKKELVFMAGKAPILTSKVRYYQVRFLDDRVLKEPKRSDTCTVIDDYESLLPKNFKEVK